MRWLAMMIGIELLLGCTAHRGVVRCNTHLQPINVPDSVAEQNQSTKVVAPSAANSTTLPKID